MSSNDPPHESLTLPDGARIAYRRLAARAGDTRPGIVFLSGFASDMTGTKGTALAAWAEARGQALLRFDYSGTATRAAPSATAPSGAGRPMRSPPSIG